MMRGSGAFLSVILELCGDAYSFFSFSMREKFLGRAILDLNILIIISMLNDKL